MVRDPSSDDMMSQYLSDKFFDFGNINDTRMVQERVTNLIKTRQKVLFKSGYLLRFNSYLNHLGSFVLQG